MKHIRTIIKERILNIFKRELDQNEKLIKNMEAYEQKKKIEQQEPKVSIRKTTRGKRRTKKNTNV